MDNSFDSWKGVFFKSGSEEMLKTENKNSSFEENSYQLFFLFNQLFLLLNFSYINLCKT